MEFPFFSRRTLLKIIVNTLSIFIVAWMLSGIELANSFTAVAVAIALALLNSFLRPLLLTLVASISPQAVMYLVLFINAGIVMIAGEFVPGFVVKSFWSAFWFSILLAIVSFFLELPEKIRQNQIIIKRMTTNPNNDPYFDNTPRQSNDSAEYQDAEIIDDNEK